MEADSNTAKHPQQLFFDNVSPATRLLEKRRQMYEVQDALENQKVRFNKDEEQFRKKEEALRQKDLQLQAQLIKFNKFLQDNEAKRRRAEQRAIDEVRAIQEREEEIKKLEKDLAEAKQTCQDLDEEVAKNRKYEEFLESVKETDDNYSEIQDLVTRFETLQSANEDLMQRQKDYERQIEALRNEYQAYRKEQENEMLALNNAHAAKRSELEEKQKRRADLEQELDAATQDTSEHNLRFGQILMSVENLYIRCTAKRGSKTLVALVEDDTSQGKEGEEDEAGQEDGYRRKKEEAIKRLKIIELYLKDFKEITETLRKEKKNDPRDRQRQVAIADAGKVDDIKFELRKEDDPRGNERSAGNSGSQGNTRPLAAVQSQPLAAQASSSGQGSGGGGGGA
jgi:DNA repair exonuclease SbcCD ATPase subunit